MLKLVLVVFTIFALTIVKANPLTNNSSVRDNNLQYFVVPDLRNFVGALIGCKSAGMRLARPSSAEETEFINNAIEARGLSAGTGYWIGAANENSYTNAWFWVETGIAIVAYKNWGTYQPRLSSSAPETGSCVRIGNYYRANEPYFWENVDCNAELYSVCEFSQQ